MNRTALYELAVATAKSTLEITGNADLSLAIATAAKSNSVADEDFPTFFQDVNGVRGNYGRMARQKLPSELNAERRAAEAARQAKADAAKTSPKPE